MFKKTRTLPTEKEKGVHINTQWKLDPVLNKKLSTVDISFGPVNSAQTSV
jgi:hypothetical protein